MTKDEILATLRSAEPQLRAKGVKRAALFGSQARGDALPDSDIDIMVERDPEAHVGTWEHVGVIHLIEDMFPSNVDVSNREGLRSDVRPSVEQDSIYAF